MNTPNDEQKQAEPRVRTCSRCNEDCHDILHKTGIIEIAVRNQSVSEYMRHWEGRTERAEADLAEAVAVVREILDEAEKDILKCDEGYPIIERAKTFLAKHSSAISGE